MSSSRPGFDALFPVPSYLLLSAASLVIADESVRVIEFARSLSGTTMRVKMFDNFSLPPSAIQGGFVNNEEALKAVLEDAARTGITHVHVTLPEERTYLFTAVIDKVPEESLKDAIAFILEENVPLKLPGAVFDTTVVGSPAPGKIRVAVAVISKKAADFYLDLFRSAGLVPLSFNLESQATAKAIVPAGDRSAQLIVKAHQAKTGLFVVADEAVQFSTMLSYGAASRRDDFKNEVMKVFDFWNNRAADGESDTEHIVKARLCGPVAFEPTFIAELSALTKVEWVTADPWANAEVEEHNLPAELSTRPLAYTATIGAGLNALHGHLFKLLPEEERVKREGEYNRRRYTLAGAGLATALLLGAAGLIPSYILSLSRLVLVRAESAALAAAKPGDAEALSAWLGAERAKLALLSPALDQARAVPAIETFLKERTAGIRITSLVWHDTAGAQPATLSVSGVALDRETLLTFESILSGSGSYADVSLPLGSLAKDKNIPFEMKLVPKPAHD